jgi:ATP-dependent Zn protease
MKRINSLSVLFYLTVVVTSAQAGTVAKDGVLSVLDPVQSYEENGDYKTISVVGRIKNNSSSYVNNIIIESQYFNEKGELIDAATEEQYSLIAPPNETIAFSVSKQAIRKKSDYSSNKVRITYAEIKSSCSTKKDNWLIQLLINWAPLIILMAVWITIVIRFQKKSPQAKTLALIEQQNELIKKNGEQFKEFLEVVREYTKKNT